VAKRKDDEYSTVEIAQALGITIEEVKEAERTAIAKLKLWLLDVIE